MVQSSWKGRHKTGAKPRSKKKFRESNMAKFRGGMPILWWGTKTGRGGRGGVETGVAGRLGKDWSYQNPTLV